MEVASFGAVDLETVRTTGTFAYISAFADFAGICAIITVFLMVTTNSRIIGQLLHAGILVMALGAVMASGSRGPAMVFGARVLGLAALGYGVRAIPMRHLLAFVAFTLLAAAVSMTVFDRQATNFLLRAQAADDVGYRVDEAFYEWLDVMAQYPLGVGLGTGHQSFYATMAATDTPDLWEVELSRLAFELGVGVFLYLAFKVALIGQLVAKMKAARTRAGQVTLAMCTIILMPLLVKGSVYEPLPNATFWAFVGIGFWIVKLEASTLPAAALVLKRTATAGLPDNVVGKGAR
jgi:hypothetical protein